MRLGAVEANIVLGHVIVKRKSLSHDGCELQRSHCTSIDGAVSVGGDNLDLENVDLWKGPRNSWFESVWRVLLARIVATSLEVIVAGETRWIFLVAL